MNKGLPTPTKQYRWGNWRCMVYEDKQTVMLIRSDGKTYMIKPSTEVIENVPEHIKDRLWRIGFLTKWRDEQLRRTAIRLRELADKHERFVRTYQTKRG